MFSNCEFRKLSEHMTKWEYRRLEELIHKGNFQFNTYSGNRVKEREIMECDISKTIECGEIIEFHYKQGASRVLLRSNSKIKGISVCVVLEISTGTIITTYINQKSDKHMSLDTGNYMNGVSLKRYLEN